MAHDVATCIYEISRRDAAKEDAEMLDRRSYSMKVYMIGDRTRSPLGSMDFGFDAKGMVHVAHAYGGHPPGGDSMVIVPYSSLAFVVDAFLYGNFTMFGKTTSVPNEDNKVIPMVKVILYRRKGQTCTQQILVQQWNRREGYMTYGDLTAKYMQIIDFARSIQS